MPRPLRVQYPGAVYHVMARGHQGQRIFRDDKDRLRFLETLAAARIFSRCLRLGIVMLCLAAAPDGTCDVAMHFQFVFGPNPARAKHMRAEDLFDGAEIEFAKACAQGDTNRMQSLLARGADVNCQGQRGMTPLFWALIHENLRGVTYLLDHGADANAKVRLKDPPTDNALTLAASLENPEFLKVLLAHGADPNAPLAASETPLFTASHSEKPKNIAILLKHGADIDWRSVSGWTPMHDAIAGRAFEIALFLYRAGADPLIKDRWGYSSVDTLVKFKDHGVVSRRDRKAYRELLKELSEKGFLQNHSAPVER